LLFSSMMVRLYSDAHFRRDSDFNHAFEKLLIESLSQPPSEIEVQDLEPPARPDIQARFKEGDSLRADLAYSTFGVVGRSGYVGATISRIARRANCSPAAVYKSHHSKEDLVVGTFVDILGAHRMKFADVADVLNDGFLAASMKDGTDQTRSLQRNFMLELFLAAAHHDQVRGAIRRQLMELESSVPDSLELDDEDRMRFSYLLRAVLTAMIGANWLATLSPTAKDLDFAQFCEPFTQTIVSRWLPDWDSMSKAIRATTPKARDVTVERR
jgi:AcrR family transcriptional regulator